MAPIDPYTMYVVEDVFSWAIWSSDNPPGLHAIPTIRRGESVRVMTKPYFEDGSVWIGIHYYNRRYEIPKGCLAPEPPPPTLGERVKDRVVLTFKKKGVLE